jgi:hypothetical protein
VTVEGVSGPVKCVWDEAVSGEHKCSLSCSEPKHYTVNGSHVCKLTENCEDQDVNMGLDKVCVV